MITGNHTSIVEGKKVNVFYEKRPFSIHITIRRVTNESGEDVFGKMTSRQLQTIREEIKDLFT